MPWDIPKNNNGAALVKRNTQKMKKIYLTLVAAALFASCTTSYHVTGVERTRILIDKRYDAQPDKEAAAFIAPYKHVVDSMMSPVVGTAAEYMAAYRPESELSNLLADILVWAGKDYGEKPDFAVYNMGGIRSALPKGTVTYGDVLEVAPFENKICFLTLTGEKVNELFEQIAAIGGEAVSHGVKLVITKNGKLASATLNGKPIDPKANYRVATIDFVAQGNDRMAAFKSKTNVVSPQDKSNNVMFVIMNYFKEKDKQGLSVESHKEGRIVVEGGEK